jgi:hypothetical protein
MLNASQIVSLLKSRNLQPLHFIHCAAGHGNFATARRYGIKDGVLFLVENPLSGELSIQFFAEQGNDFFIELPKVTRVVSVAKLLNVAVEIDFWFDTNKRTFTVVSGPKKLVREFFSLSGFNI